MTTTAPFAKSNGPTSNVALDLNKAMQSFLRTLKTAEMLSERGLGNDQGQTFDQVGFGQGI